MTVLQNRQILLAKRPVGMPSEENFPSNWSKSLILPNEAGFFYYFKSAEKS